MKLVSLLLLLNILIPCHSDASCEVNNVLSGLAGCKPAIGNSQAIFGGCACNCFDENLARLDGETLAHNSVASDTARRTPLSAYNFTCLAPVISTVPPGLVVKPNARPLAVWERLAPPAPDPVSMDHAIMPAHPYMDCEFNFVRASRQYYMRQKPLEGYESFLMLNSSGLQFQAWSTVRNRTCLIHVYTEEEKQMTKTKYALKLAFYYALRHSARVSHAFDAYMGVNGREIIRRYGPSLEPLRHFSHMYMVVTEMPLEENFRAVLLRHKAENSTTNLELLIRSAMLQMVQIVDDIRCRTRVYCAGLRLASFRSPPFDPENPAAYRLQVADVTDITFHRGGAVYNDKKAPEIILDIAESDSAPEVWNLGILFMEMLMADRDIDFLNQEYKYTNIRRQYIGIRYFIQLFGRDWLPTEDRWPGITHAPNYQAVLTFNSYFGTLDLHSRPALLPFSQDFLAKANDLLWRMLVIVPHERIELADIFRHPFFQT